MTPTRSSCFSLSLIVALCVGSTRVESLQLRHYPKVSVPHGVSPETAPQQHDTTSRRKGLALLLFGAPALLSRAAWAASTSVEFQNVGQQAPLPAGETNAFVTLDNGVQVKTYREGTGTDVVKVGNRVDIQCSGRLLNLNGVVFYNTKNNNPDGYGALPLSFVLGTGRALPGLESGILGMKKGGIRRIIVPANLAYSQFPDLEPQPMSSMDRRALDSVVKNPRRDGTILFDVQLERFK